MKIRSVIMESKPNKLSSPPRSVDHSDHMLRATLLGYPQLAADHLLNKETRKRLSKIVGNFIRRANLEFRKSLSSDSPKKILTRSRAYEALLEIALNLIGIEADRAEFPEEERENSLMAIRKALEEWESLDKKVAKETVAKFLNELRKVQKGKSLAARMANEIEEKLIKGKEESSFLKAAQEAIQENIYYKMTKKGICKFGNDYATGLRWVRHLGFVQVSTNPSLAAMAFDDFPELWEEFKESVKERPSWVKNPEKYADEIAMEGTIIALLDNLRVFAPIVLLSDWQDGLISYQLNPHITGSLEESVSDALQVYSRIRKLLKVCNEWLTWGYQAREEAGRPDVVFKVSGDSEAACKITSALCSLGIGTNDTVVFSVAQEALLILYKFEGLAKAVKRGMPITQTYETNMGGRLEYHLRDIIAADLLRKALDRFDRPEEVVDELAKNLKVDVKELSLEEKIELVTSAFKGNMRDFLNDSYVDVIARSGIKGTKEETIKYLKKLEKLMHKAGTYVTQRVYQIYFSPKNRPKWIKCLREKYGLSSEQAEDIMRKVDVLPASKRRPSDTYHTLARRNMTNTEFPNHQVAMVKKSEEEGFKLSKLENSALWKPDPEILKKLYQFEDFRKGYELTPELKERLKEVGIDTKGFGTDGLRPDEWSDFGPAVKTMEGFTNAYNKFRDKAIKVIKKMSE